jgi:hypothetical protein
MSKAQIINTIVGLNEVDYLSTYTGGSFRMITKVRAGFASCTNCRPFDNERIFANPELALSGHRRGALQTVEFCPEGGDYWLTVFARVGKRIKLIDTSILRALTVGTVNSFFDNTNLMCMEQYKAVNSKSWASYAFQLNEYLEAKSA